LYKHKDSKKTQQTKQNTKTRSNHIMHLAGMSTTKSTTAVSIICWRSASSTSNI